MRVFRFGALGFSVLLVYLILPTIVGAAICPNLTRNLSRGMSGEDVRQLQQFLIEHGHLAPGNTTGYYGALTEAAVKDFQCERDIVCSGSPATTGWGNVGPRTREVIAQVCSVAPVVPSIVTMTASPPSGPAPLSVNFSISASQGVCYSYVLDYGDGRSDNIPSFCGSRTLQHSYSTQGNYSARLDRIVVSGGQQVRVTQAQTTISVGAVQTVPPTCTMSANRTSISPNDPVTITWSSTNATSATWGDGATTGTSGNAVFTNISSTVTKSINFTGPGGSRSCSVTITVTQPAVTATRVTVTGNAIANGGVINLASGLNSNFKLAEFVLNAAGSNAAVLKSLLFTIRNQRTQGSGSGATVANIRTIIGGTTYTSTTSVDGVFTDNRVQVPSAGITIPQNGTLGVSILADITPLAAGTLDLWIYPENLGLAVAGSAGTTITASSSVTNRVDQSLIYWSGWISTGTSGGGSGNACYMNGVGHAVDPSEEQCDPFGAGGQRYDSATLTKCHEWFSTPRCTANGWVNVSWGGGYINPQNVTVGCTTHNGLYVPGNMRVYGNRCTDPNREGNFTNCDWQYVCKRDGWWRLDGAGFEIENVSEAPWVAPETFYPPINVTP